MKKLLLTTTFALTTSGLLAIGAYAGATNETIQAYINHSISVKINNKAMKMVDANGNPVDPIVYNGTSYFPIRAISNALGFSVDWDETSKIISLTQGANVQSGTVSESQVIDYLIRKVPEIKAKRDFLNANNVKMVFSVEGKKGYIPGDTAQYYSVYVGESHPDHNVRWETFLVKEDLTDIYVYRLLTDSYVTLQEWQAGTGVD
ncbi:stalk domain-containing protein [Paenibacillus sp. P36]|uniref:stalk domain-containing protein n=1 Tax=Paenibacillus sp. P36 TaxID=3342538 RepID=UPI0038B29941